MATLYITEFADVNATMGTLIPKQPPNAEQTVAIGGTTTSSSAFAQNTQYVTLSPDAICSISIAATPTATAAKMRMIAGEKITFQVPQGAKVAVITNT